MTEQEITNTYILISRYYEQYLRNKNVKLPNLKNKDGQYTKDALVLIKLAENYPNTKAVSKQELTQFIHKFYPDVPDVQQARHLSMQKGWYIESGQRGDNSQIEKGSYKLISLEEEYPGYTPERRAGFVGDFDALKNAYDNRCATCGAKEGTKHWFRKNKY